MFLFNALKFVDHVPSRLKCCNDNASMKNLNSLLFLFCFFFCFTPWGDVMNTNTPTDIRNQLCTTRRKLVRSRRRLPPRPVYIFYNDSTNQTEWCSKTSFQLVYFKERKKKVWRIFCGIFIFHQVLDVIALIFIFLCSLLE